MATASKDGPRALVSIILRGSPKRLAPQDDEVAIPSNNCRIKVVIRVRHSKKALLKQHVVVWGTG
jgi:hypothetical protein